MGVCTFECYNKDSSSSDSLPFPLVVAWVAVSVVSVCLLSFNCTPSGCEAPNLDSNKFAIVIFEYCFIYSLLMRSLVPLMGVVLYSVHMHVVLDNISIQLSIGEKTHTRVQPLQYSRHETREQCFGFA